jgi:hypothetical protein
MRSSPLIGRLIVVGFRVVELEWEAIRYPAMVLPR